MAGRGGSFLGQVAWLAGESVRGFRRSRRVAVAATFSIGLSCSVLFVFLYAWQAFGAWAQTQRDAHGWIEVYLKDGASLVDNSLLVTRLPGVDSVRNITAEEARVQFRKEFGPEMLEALDHNPLPQSLRVHVRSTAGQDNAAMTELVQSLQALPGAEDVRASQGSLAQVEQLETWASRLAIGTAALLALVLLGIVHNSISLSLGARDALIDNMRLCGASPWHMEVPFAAEGFLQGTLGGLVATVLPWLGILAVARFFPLPLPLSVDWALNAGLAVVAFSATLGTLSGWWTIRRSVR